MTSYAPVARSAGATQRHQAPAGRNFHENGGIRTEWWWEDGPVDTCCICCTLRTGVGLLAAIDLVLGIITVLFNAAFDAMFDISLSLLKSEYSRNCTDDIASTVDCDELMEAIKEQEGSFSLYFVLLQVQGIIRVVAGAAGLFAVSSDNTKAARVYMLSWPVDFFLGLLMMLKRKWSARGGPADQDEGFQLLIIAVHMVIIVYYFKVSWSYYKRRLDHETSAHSNTVPWNAMHQEQPMINMPIA